MDLGLRDRVAIVAAGSKGLGRAVAEELAAEGAAVVMCARGRDALQAACSRIEAAGGRAHPVVADVTDTADIVRVVAEARRVFGPIEILVTNTGGPRTARFEQLTADDWAAATRTLLTSAVEFARAALPDMRERRWGRILNITSIAVKQPIAGLMLSNSLRSAVTAFARTLANEVAGEGITVNNLMPGYTRTERMIELSRMLAEGQGSTPAAVLAKLESEIPMGRLGEPREFAAMAAFLASDRATYITGQSIAIDGGWIRSLL